MYTFPYIPYCARYLPMYVYLYYVETKTGLTCCRRLTSFPLAWPQGGKRAEEDGYFLSITCVRGGSHLAAVRWILLPT